VSAEALHYWRLATQYLDLTEAVSTELVRSGNPWVIVASELSDAQYRESTTWSDHWAEVLLPFGTV